MDKLTTVFLHLLRAGLWEAPPNAALFPLSNEEWARMYFAARKQTVQGVIYDAICQLPEELLPPMDLFVNWMQEVQRMEQTFHQHLKALNWLNTRLQTEANITPVVLKGIGLASCYPNPSHRLTGDIDLFYGNAQRCEQVNKLIEHWGLPVQRGLNDESLFMLNSVIVEQHGHMLLTHQPFRSKNLYHWLDTEMEKEESTRQISISQTRLTLLSPILDILQLLMHSLKHLLNEGIGFRQLCDIAVYYEKNRQIIDDNSLYEVLKIFGIQRWAYLVFNFCTQYLGLHEDILPPSLKVNSKKTEKLLAEIWKSGNFGHMDERNLLRPESEMGGKIFTAQRLLKNSFIFFREAPREALGAPGSLIISRLKELL